MNLDPSYYYKRTADGWEPLDEDEYERRRRKRYLGGDV